MTSHTSTWNRVEVLLRAAFAELPATLTARGVRASDPSDLVGNPEDFFEFLDHNELELAWDELALMGRRSRTKSDVFWSRLSTAAEAMNLPGKVTEALEASRVEE